MPRTARPSRFRAVLSVFVGLVIPFFGVAVAPFLLDGIKLKILGLPFLYFWLFAWFVLTTVCLAVCWYFIDGPVHEEPDEWEEW